MEGLHFMFLGEMQTLSNISEINFISSITFFTDLFVDIKTYPVIYYPSTVNTFRFAVNIMKSLCFALFLKAYRKVFKYLITVSYRSVMYTLISINVVG